MSAFHEKQFPDENEAYREARDRLLKAEMELRGQVEKVAALRRELPLGGPLKEDYVFEESNGGAAREVAFSSLFAAGKDSLILYNLMFGSDWENPCPMCTSIVDGYQGNAAYVQEVANLVIVAKAPVHRIQEWAGERGWSRLRLLSSEKNAFNRDYNAEFPSSYGDQHPVLHVFARRDDGIYHFWSSELLYCPTEGNARHVDLTWPLWNLLDLTPEGRSPNWYPSFQK